MDGYRDPALNEEAFRGGWLHTGDVAVRDKDGFLRIVDRTKDMIVSGGFNIYPREIEDILAEHPAVSQVAVIGVPHEKWGEAVTAIVVLKPGMTVDPVELCGPVAQRKGSFQAPNSSMRSRRRRSANRTRRPCARNSPRLPQHRRYCAPAP